MDKTLFKAGEFGGDGSLTNFRGRDKRVDVEEFGSFHAGAG